LFGHLRLGLGLSIDLDVLLALWREWPNWSGNCLCLTRPGVRWLRLISTPLLG
jgi:hypothetical protein